MTSSGTVALHVEESGSGVPLVLLHAFPLDHRMWSVQRSALASQARVITPDLRGFGRSPLGDGAPSLDRMADDVAALLDRLGLHDVVLGGLSMGGYVAMAFARRHRERLSGLALCDTKASADPPAARDNRERIATAVLAEGSVQPLHETTVPALVGDTTRRDRPEVVARVRSIVDDAPPAGVAWAQRAMAARGDSFDVLRGLDVPAVLVVGAEDTLSTLSDIHAMAEALPRARVVVVPSAGHLTALERPEVVTDALGELVAEVGGPRAG